MLLFAIFDLVNYNEAADFKAELTAINIIVTTQISVWNGMRVMMLVLTSVTCLLTWTNTAYFDVYKIALPFTVFIFAVTASEFAFFFSDVGSHTPDSEDPSETETKYAGVIFMYQFSIVSHIVLNASAVAFNQYTQLQREAFGAKKRLFFRFQEPVKPDEGTQTVDIFAINKDIEKEKTDRDNVETPQNSKQMI